MLRAIKATTDKTLDLSIKGRLGMVIDGTGRDYDKINLQTSLLKQLGYDCYMIFVNTSLDVALKGKIEDEKELYQNILQETLGQKYKVI